MTNESQPNMTKISLYTVNFFRVLNAMKLKSLLISMSYFFKMNLRKGTKEKC